MNSMMKINTFLDADFEDRIELEEFNQENTKEEATDYFERYFEDMYNGEMDYVDLSEIKELCNFNTIMNICEYVFEKYVDFGMTIDGVEFGDKILKSYIYFYYMENNKQEFITKIEDHYDAKAEETDESEGEGEDEKCDFPDSLQGEKLRIIHEREWVDIKPYSHNIIAASLRVVASKYGQEEANKLIDECELEKLGWKKVKV